MKKGNYFLFFNFFLFFVLAIVLLFFSLKYFENRQIKNLAKLENNLFIMYYPDKFLKHTESSQTIFFLDNLKSPKSLISLTIVDISSQNLNSTLIKFLNQLIKNKKWCLELLKELYKIDQTLLDQSYIDFYYELNANIRCILSAKSSFNNLILKIIKSNNLIYFIKGIDLTNNENNFDLIQRSIFSFTLK